MKQNQVAPALGPLPTLEPIYRLWDPFQNQQPYWNATMHVIESNEHAELAERTGRRSQDSSVPHMSISMLTQAITM